MGIPRRSRKEMLSRRSEMKGARNHWDQDEVTELLMAGFGGHSNTECHCTRTSFEMGIHGFAEVQIPWIR